jgi:hypothetical protein
MARDIVTSENRAEFMAKKLGIEDKPTHSINVNDREIPVNLHPVEERQGHTLHYVDVDKFDKAFEKNSDQYIGKGGTGNTIKNRYQGVHDFLEKAESMRASESHVKPDGRVTFGDGRHRFAYLRDKGLKEIPMSFDKESVIHAKKHGYISDKKAK